MHLASCIFQQVDLAKTLNYLEFPFTVITSATNSNQYIFILIRL
jgi:hypothetical protein